MISKTKYGEAQRWFDAHSGYEGTDCLIWPFSSKQAETTKLRPMIRRDGKTRSVSRLFCEIKHGAPPSDIHEAAHSCGKGHLGCVNPSHLRWATPQENTDDKTTHGTMLRGEQMAASKLTETGVRQMRKLYDSHKENTNTLSLMFPVNNSTAWNVVSRSTWKHVPAEAFSAHTTRFIR